MNIRANLILLFYFFLKRRYIIDIKGGNILKVPGPKLILPNHQSQVDAQLMAVITAQYCDFVPIVSERIVRIPVIGNFLRAWNVVSVSDLQGGNRDPEVLNKIFSKVQGALQAQKSVILYPSGNITYGPLEKIKNKQSAYALVSGLPEQADVIGVRISGLWGSMWSVAWTGEKPDFGFTFAKGVFFVVANLIFLSPKRHVTIEFTDITKQAKKMALSDRKTFNNYLEDFYNVNGPEEVTYIKHFFFMPRINRKYPEKLRKAS